jgi:eukaryotic-like serine/threonine-protein kinase
MHLNPGYGILKSGDRVRKQYQIICQLGQGGFGITYQAQDITINNEIVFVALKQISQIPQNNHAVIREDEYLEDLKKEDRALRHLNHNYIPKCIDSFTENNYFYLVQEYIEGHNLAAEIIPGKQISETEIIAILKHILEILKFVHRQKIIHRDLKPANLIRRTSDNKIFLIDFGAVKEIATLNHNSSGVSLTKAIGTSGYTPHEQWEGNPQFNSDIYALGIIALQMVTDLSLQDIKNCNLESNKNYNFYIWQEEAYPYISDSLKKIVTKMIEARYQNRYQSVKEALHDLYQLEV